MIFQLGAFLFFRPQKGEEQKSNEDFENPSQDDGVYENDFSKVGSGERNIDVKPIDLSGNAILHAQETLKEDMQKIEDSVPTKDSNKLNDEE